MSTTDAFITGRDLMARETVHIASVGAETPNGGYAPVPYRITVNGRDVSAREARDVAYHASIDDGSHIRINTDLFGANAATIGQMICAHRLAGQNMEETIPNDGPVKIAEYREEES